MAAHEEGGGDRFSTTHVSAVLGVKSDDDGERTRSLEAGNTAYWKPVYTHVRHPLALAP